MMMTATTFAARQHRLERKANGKASGQANSQPVSQSNSQSNSKGTKPEPDRDDADQAPAPSVDSRADCPTENSIGNATDRVEPIDERATEEVGEQLGGEQLGHDRSPWRWPRIVRQLDGHSNTKNKDIYTLLKQRLARVPSLSKHTRQTLYVDLWTGQYWLGLSLSSGENPACQNQRSTPPIAKDTELQDRELLAPVSSDTAISIASSPFGLQ